LITENNVSSDEITINAPAEVVWEVLVDFDNYHVWNDFCPGIDAQLEMGSPVVMQVDLGNGPQPQTEYITRLEPPHVITWSMENKPGDPVHADRSQYVTPIDDTSCTYLTVDEFSGEAVASMMEAFGKAMEDGFNRCARGLKTRAEALYQAGA
jgi:uncharacterized protein YndB with AHSA1/START domain